MKKFFYGLTALLMTCFLSCKGFEIQPKFISVLGTDEKSFTLLESKQLPDNSVQLVFSEPVELKELAANVLGKACVCTVTKKITDGREVQLITIADTIEIGESYCVSASAQCGNTSQDFTLQFKGKNTRPARLALSEYKPEYQYREKAKTQSSKNVTTPQFIELVVERSGNVSGMKITSIGPRKDADYSFPVCEVSEGEVIVVHLNPETFPVGAEDELGKNTSGGETSGRDFFAQWKEKAPARKSNIVLLENEDAVILDYFFYIQKSDYVDGAINWKTMQAVAERLLASPFKEDFTERQNKATAISISSSYSYAKSGNDWVKTQDITCGKKNGSITPAK